MSELNKYLRYERGKTKNGYTEIVDSWNHHCVAVKVRYSEDIKIIMDALEVAHIKEQNAFEESRRGDMFYNARHNL